MTQLTPEQRQAIWDAVTPEERLKVVSQRMSPAMAQGRKGLAVAVAFPKGSSVYKLIEEMHIYFGYPVGGKLNERTGRVEFQSTKETGACKWRTDESMVSGANEAFRLIISAILFSDSPEVISVIRKAVANHWVASLDSRNKAKDFFDKREQYLSASKETKNEQLVEESCRDIGHMTKEQREALCLRMLQDGLITEEMLKVRS